MPVKRRLPKGRTVPVTDHAIDLFERMARMPRGSHRWYDLHSELHREVGAKPWEFPLDGPNAAPLWDALSAAAAAARARRCLTEEDIAADEDAPVGFLG